MKGNANGINFGYLYQKTKNPYVELHFTFSKGSLLGGDFNRQYEKLHHIQVDNQNLFGWNFFNRKFALIPYVGLGLFLKSEIPYDPMDYCSIAYALFLPLGLRISYDIVRPITLLLDVQTQLKLDGSWFILGHPMFTMNSSRLSYRNVFNAKFFLFWKINRTDYLALAPFYKRLNLRQKHALAFFDEQRVQQWGFSFLYYFYF